MFGVTELYAGGVATEYCVKFTVIDAIKGVELKKGDSGKALEAMLILGAKKTTYASINR